jgi:hypothetical protein
MSAKDRREKAIQAYRDQQTQDNEGGVPCPTSFIAGHMAAGKEHQEEIERLKAELEKERALTTKYQNTFAKLYNVAPENPSPEIEETFKKHFKDI